MGHKYSEYEKELYSRVDEVIHYIWDPIGISSYPGARDEYYSYLPEIFQNVITEDKQALENLLKKISVDHMCLNENLESIKSAISVMIDWKRFLESKYNTQRPKKNEQQI